MIVQNNVLSGMFIQNFNQASGLLQNMMIYKQTEDSPLASWDLTPREIENEAHVSSFLFVLQESLFF